MALMAQSAAPVSIVITLEPRRGDTIPAIEAQDITVRQGKEKRPVTGLVSVANAETQLLLLIDDSSRSSFNTEISTLKKFVQSLPPNFDVGVGYMRNGLAQMTQEFTSDHALAAKGIRVVSGPGGADVSPYDSLTEAIKKWPDTNAKRKEVLMISSGIEGLGGGFVPDNPYVNAGIASAQKAGVLVYTIYNPSVGHYGRSFWRQNWGQSFLSQLSDESGGDSYYIGFGSPVSFQPYLQEFLKAQPNQYLLSFVPKPENKAGLQQIKVSIDSKDASIAAADKVFVKANM